MHLDEYPFTCQREKKEDKKGYRVSSFALLLVILKRPHGSEGVKSIFLFCSVCEHFIATKWVLQGSMMPLQFAWGSPHVTPLSLSTSLVLAASRIYTWTEVCICFTSVVTTVKTWTCMYVCQSASLVKGEIVVTVLLLLQQSERAFACRG